MSVVGITLPGSSKNSQPLKLCSKCGKHQEPTGGVQMSQNQWRCASCWRGFRFRK